LLLRALGNAQDASCRNTKLWIDVQRSMRAAYDDDTGGFYGRRVFSWSTANGLYAVRSSEPNLKDIPPRPAESPSSIKVGSIILVLVVLFGAGVVYLAHEDHFTTLVAFVFIVLLLAVLLAFGKIREATFKDLVLKLNPGAGKDGKDDKGADGSASNDA
jgi:peptidoglycan/LPS O-acetylase OafA/YrhL